MTQRILLITLITAMSWSAPVAAKLLHQERSLYANIVVDQQGDLRCLKFTHKRRNSNQSCLDVSDPNRLVFAYAKMTLMSMLLAPSPERVLIIGLGGGTLPMALRAMDPGVIIDTIEIDPAVVRVAATYFGFQPDDGSRVIEQDARVFGKRAKLRGSEYDLIILDAFNGDYIPEHLMTAEFLEEMRALLAPDGMLIANTFATSALYHHESATYAEVFGDFLNFRARETGNRIVIIPQADRPASERESVDFDIVEVRAEAQRKHLERFNIPVDRFLRMLSQLPGRKPDWDADKRPLTDQYAPANLLRGKED